ncbi:MAG: hypothetical protein ACHQNE_03365 [Candidatus Kapaibacterium sp.]
MTTFRSLIFALISILAVSLLSSCDHSTSVNSNNPSIPAVGSIFTYVDSTWYLRSGFDTLIADSATFPESDTVLGSGTFFAKPNAIRFSSSAFDLVRFTQSGGALDSEIVYPPGLPNPPYYIAYESSGDISMPAILTITGSDSSMQWLTFPIISHTTFRSIKTEYIPKLGMVTEGDSVVAAPNMTITVGDTAYDCEHAIDYHFYHSDSGFSDPPSKLEIFFSPVLGVPLQATMSVQKQSGIWDQAFTKRLVSFTN